MKTLATAGISFVVLGIMLGSAGAADIPTQSLRSPSRSFGLGMAFMED